MKVRLDGDEFYPIYFVVEERGVAEVEVDEATALRWRTTHEAFFKCQDEMVVAMAKRHE